MSIGVMGFLSDPDTRLLLSTDPLDVHAEPGQAFTPAELARRWRISAAKVRELIASGEVPGFRVGPRLYRVRGEDVQAFEARRAESKPCTPRKRKGERSAEDVRWSTLRAGWKREAKRAN